MTLRSVEAIAAIVYLLPMPYIIWRLTQIIMNRDRR